MSARVLSLTSLSAGKGVAQIVAVMYRESQETGFATHINHVPGGERRSHTRMSTPSGRSAVSSSFASTPSSNFFGGVRMRIRLLSLLSALFLTLSAHAVV